MKQNLRLRGLYCLKQIRPTHHIHLQYAPDKWDTYAESSRTRPAFLRTFFGLSPAISREFIGAYAGCMRENHGCVPHTPRARHGRWQNTGRRKSGAGVLGLRKAKPIPCFSPPSLIPHSGHIPVIPVYISVKRPKSDTLPKGTRHTYGRKAHSDMQGMGHGSGWSDVGGRLGSASELDATSKPTRCALNAPECEQGALKVASRWLQVQSELPTQLGESLGIVHRVRHGAVPRYRRIIDRFCSGITRASYTHLTRYKRWLIRGLYVANTWLKGRARISQWRMGAARSPWQLGPFVRTCRKNSEESCVCTHAKAPARSGLGLALGVMVIAFLLFTSATGLYAQTDAQREAGVVEPQTLQVGARVPAEFWTTKHLVYHNGDTSWMSLEQYKGKFLILDFWATWCGYCRNNLPKLEALKAEFSDELAVMLVNVKRRRDTYEKVAYTYRTTLTEQGGASLPSIVYDEYLIKRFPHSAIPHYVWISPKGKILAITNNEFVHNDQLIILLKSKNI
ncbi:TlpA disulfide reductase family protein [Parapedobacter tibetensis]|uniref:TlpA disulfide reductase family protein n=1 Tax=Parapedobacter tibetensis TaxID=2972951 RepID=UPI00214D62F3|nr:TlpA disulfide reductase family protein [Parapedobacter tibetensis]